MWGHRQIMSRKLFGALRFAGVGADQRSSTGYRPDIDGLRGIAVIAVVLFHLDFRSISGGFVGVDIFFVISGYLIGKSILEQRRERRFSLLAFYERRLRRIAPALVAVLAATTIAAWFILLPTALENYGASLAAAILSISNIYFWFKTDYFAPAAHEQPLLHTWSLGVEEQFYILLPLILIITARTRHNEIKCLAALGAVSMILSILLTRDHASANFYLIPTRAWELLAGLLAAELHFKSLITMRALRELIASLSLAVLALCILLYDPSTPFPGATALPPVLATAALLSVGGHGLTFVGRALGLRPLVWVGLISYSLYLWHWPIIVMMKQWLPVGWLRMPDRALALAIMFTLAFLSWRLVERPFRSKRISGRAIWWFSGLSALALLVAGVMLVVAKGAPNRLSPDVAAIVADLESPQDDRPDCFVGLYATPGTFVPSTCLERDETRPNVLILGDSHSNHLRYGLVQRYPDINFLQAGAAGCRMTIEPAPNETPTCRAFRDRVFSSLLTDNPPEHVLLALFWGDDALSTLKTTIEWMNGRGIKVVIGGPVPRYEVPLPQILALSKMRGDPSLPERLRIPGTAEADETFAAFAASQGVGYMSSYSAICPNGRCIVQTAAGTPVQSDSHHLNDTGSLLAARAYPTDNLGLAD